MIKKIIDMSSEELKNTLTSNSITVCVVGIGRIGLPTELSFANSGLPTMGVDINSKLIEMINSKTFPLKDEPGYDVIFEKVINDKFNVTTKLQDVVPNSDVVILSLPTPMNENNIPDYSALLSVGRQLGELLSKDSLVIVESTVEPGFIENKLINTIENSQKKLVAGKDFAIGVCPETANPGQIMNDFEKLPRLVGAIDEKTTNVGMLDGVVTTDVSHTESGCNCVAFTFVTLQDYWLGDVQVKVIDTFVQNDVRITTGIIGNLFGNDADLVDYIKNSLQENKKSNEIAINGWSYEDFTSLTKNEQSSLIKQSNDKITSVL